MDASAETQIGQLAAKALDQIDGRPLAAALILVVVENGLDEDGDRSTEARWYVPDDQLSYTTLGMIDRLHVELLGD